MDDVEAHVAGPREADDRVQVRAVVVEECAGLMEDPRDLLDALVEEAERRRVREHQPGRPLVHLPAQVLEVEVPACVRLDALELVARHRHARGIRAMGGVGRDDRVALLAAVGEVRAHEQESGQLALRARGRLQRHSREPGDLGEDPLQVPHQLERALGALVLLMRVEIAETGQPADALVDAGVVLHRAGAERVEARVDAERPVREGSEVANELGLGELGEARRARAASESGSSGFGSPSPARVRRVDPASTARRSAARRPRRVRARVTRSTSSSDCASRSMSSGVRFSVTATRSTSSIPS